MWGPLFAYGMGTAAGSVGEILGGLSVGSKPPSPSVSWAPVFAILWRSPRCSTTDSSAFGWSSQWAG